MKTEPRTTRNLPQPATKRPALLINYNAEWRAMLVIAAGLALLYFLTAQPVASGDPTLALVAALANERLAVIDHFMSGPGGGLLTSMSQGSGLAYYAGHYYSAAAPGSAFLALPFFAVGQLFGPDGALGFVSGLVALAGAGVVLFFYGLARRVGCAVASARYAALTLGVASAAWREATRFGPGTFSLLLITLALWLALPPLPRDENDEGGRKLMGWRAAVLGLTLGLAVVVDYPNLLWTVLFGSYLLWQRRLGWRGGIMAGAGWLVGVASLPVYNWLNFGRPWTFSYNFLLEPMAARSLKGQFLAGFGLDNLRQVIFSDGRGALGFFLLIFGLWGLVALYGQRGKRPETLFIATLMAVSLLVGLLRPLVAPGAERIDVILPLLPGLALGTAVWHERFMFLTRLEQWWLPGLALYGVALYYWIAGTLFNLSGLVYLLPLVLLVALAALLWRLTPIRRWQKSLALAGLTLLVGLALTLGNGSDRPAIAALGNNNLLANPALACADSKVAGWYLQNAPMTCPKTGQPFLKAGEQLQPYLLPVQGGKVYSLSFDSAAVVQLDWLWLDEGQQPVAPPGGEIRREVCPNCRYTDNRAAPPGAAYLRLVFTASGPGSLANFQFLDDSVRLEPMPDYAKAALSFSFDWESAMGGLIHSKGGGPAATLQDGEAGTTTGISEANIEAAVADATERGLAMRQGAEFLLNLFTKNKVSGTFYATGYNLLDGNRQKLLFDNSPIYKWASPKNRWPSDYWLTHSWYANDPYGDDKSDPAWYFGDQTERLRSGGQDIQSHTFGHLYVRGTTPQEFREDMETFLYYAGTRHLPITSFAFPWKSSNSVGPEWYGWLADHGFTSVTRLYDQDQGIFLSDGGALKYDNGQRNAANQPLHADYAGPNNYYYYLSNVKVEPRLLALHDYQLIPGDTSLAQARAVIDEVLTRRGYGSIWTHPEAIVTPSDQTAWTNVVEYAVQKRSAGLWVDSVANIIQRRLDTAKIGQQAVWSNQGHHLRLTLTNPTDHAIAGLTLTLPAPIKSVSGAASFKEAQLVAPSLPAGQSVTVEVEF